MIVNRSLSAACEMGNHDGCYKGRHDLCNEPHLHWCTCDCHPYHVHKTRWQRFREWLWL